MDQYITFETPSAEAAVRNFDIQCPQPGKSINLMDVLRAAERQATGPKGTPLYTTVESRDDELRVYHQIRLADGRHNEPHVVMTVNKWDELQFFGITKAAVMTTCYL